MKIIKIDHCMFPFYNNIKILSEINKYYDKRNYTSNIEKQTSLYRGTYLYTKKYYIEHLSTIKGQYNWTNSLCIVLDKKYWKYYKNPDSVNEHFLRPKFGCGYFLVDPKSPYTNWRKNLKVNKINKNNFTILISKKLEKELMNLGGCKWKIPNYIKTDKRLCHFYDIVIMNNTEIIAPLFQSNIPLIE